MLNFIYRAEISPKGAEDLNIVPVAKQAQHALHIGLRNQKKRQLNFSKVVEGFLGSFR